MEKEQKNVRWEKCTVNGWITACDPGCNRTSGYHRTYKREEINEGMDLCYYEGNLPSVVVKEIADDYIVVHVDGAKRTIYTGGYYSSNKKGLNYAYSEVDVYLNAE